MLPVLYPGIVTGDDANLGTVERIGKIIKRTGGIYSGFLFLKNYCIFEDIYQYLTFWKL